MTTISPIKPLPETKSNTITPMKQKSSQHHRTMTPATKVLLIDQNINKHTEDAVPLITLLYESLNNVESAHLSVDEFLILGEAICGHPPTTESCCLQIHRCRASLACKEVNDLFVDQFAGSITYNKKKKKISREDESHVRDFVTSRLRECISTWLFEMFPSYELETYRSEIQNKLETFYSNLANGTAAGSDNKKLGKILRKQFELSRDRISKTKANHQGVNPNRIALELHLMSFMLMDKVAIEHIIKMPNKYFFVTSAQWQSFAINDLIGATKFSNILADKPTSIVTFLTVVLERVWLLQGRLNLIQQNALKKILDKRLNDKNYNFAVDVRARQAKNPDRRQAVVRQAVEERLFPSGVEWRFHDGKWIMEDEL